MSSANTNLALRNDTILGVCEAIGQDFGFHANWIRLTLAGLFYWFPFQVIGAYLLMGAIVFVSRWIAPASSDAPIVALAAEVEHPDEAAVQEDLAIAA